MKTPNLHSNEVLLISLPSIGLALYKSGINYRAMPTLPLIQDIGLFITNHRAILRGEIFMSLYDKDIDFWFPDHAPSADSEIITAVQFGHSSVAGDSLKISTRSEKEHFLRAKDAEFQIFVKHAQDLLQHFPAALVRPLAEDLG